MLGIDVASLVGDEADPGTFELILPNGESVPFSEGDMEGWWVASVPDGLAGEQVQIRDGESFLGMLHIPHGAELPTRVHPAKVAGGKVVDVFLHPDEPSLSVNDFTAAGARSVTSVSTRQGLRK